MSILIDQLEIDQEIKKIKQYHADLKSKKDELSFNTKLSMESTAWDHIRYDHELEMVRAELKAFEKGYILKICEIEVTKRRFIKKGLKRYLYDFHTNRFDWLHLITTLIAIAGLVYFITRLDACLSCWEFVKNVPRFVYTKFQSFF